MEGEGTVAKLVKGKVSRVDRVGYVATGLI